MAQSLQALLQRIESMSKRIWVVAIALAIGALAVGILPISARALSGATSAPAQITDPINDNDVISIPGNIPPGATAANDRGRVPDDFPLDHLIVLLRRSPQRERALEQLLGESKIQIRQTTTIG